MIYALGRGEAVTVLRADGDEAGELLAKAVGHRGEAGAYPLDDETLLAVAQRADPPEDGWRWLVGEVDFVAFADSPAVHHEDPRVVALLRRALAGRVEEPGGTTLLWRPIGPGEHRLLDDAGWRAFPPRRPESPIFYPVLNRVYAEQIAQEWNVPASGRGYVTEFRVDTAFGRRYPTRRAGGSGIDELWVPAEDLDAFNAHLRGPITVVAEFGCDRGIAGVG